MFLPTTADQRFWKVGEKTLFLGNWCKVYDQERIWSVLDHEVLPYHWDDRSRLFEDYKYISPKEFLPKGELQAKLRGPYCITWCMMYLHYKLLNKDIPTKTIIKRMTQIDTTFLMRYMKYIENTIKNKNKKYMKYKNTVKNKK